MTTLYNGYVPPTDKLCLRCKQVFRSNLYMLCPNCQQDDIEQYGEIRDDTAEDAAEERDLQEIISWARGQ